ncbi:RNA-binding domain-containing protein [Algibacter lectus]|uniref:RNA-binding domain-containing protein n=1 Tax=Algibacter lectus TaxID=221126 RepID=UPI0026ED147E|nr:RNA-binding domain-containing protein [Algibacter lectus]MDO7138891.1 ATP-binding protein [Algibacter lectus]
MTTEKINSEEITTLLKLNEDHFNDFKSNRIKPSKLQETFVSFANADGGEIYVGIEDKKVSTNRVIGFLEQESANDIISVLLEETSPSVENVQIEFLKTEKDGLILKINIPKSPKVHYTSNGDCFIRINALSKKIKGERITTLAYSKGAELYEKKIVEGAEFQDIIDSGIIQKYQKRINSKQELFKFARKQRLLSKKDNNYFPNVSCVLLFDDEPQAILQSRSAVKVYRLRTTNKEYKREHLQEMPKTINGPLEDVIHKTIKQVGLYLADASFQVGEKLVKLEYPTEALKEVLVNAVIHRDYSLNDDIHIKIFDNRIEILSPGKLPGYMSIDNLYEERFSRNPNVVRMLHNLPNPVNHDIGEGLDTVKNELKKAGLIAPIFKESDNYFIVTIKHQKIASIEDIVIKYLNKNPTVELSNKLVRQLSGEDDMQKVKKSLQKLRKNNVIKIKDTNASAFDYRYIKF